jgi:MFS family permease
MQNSTMSAGETPVSPTAPDRQQAEISSARADGPAPFRYYRRNYLISTIEGGLFGAGVVFTDGSTVLPRLIDSLHGPSWLIAMMPLAGFVGMVLPQLFVVNYVERRSLMKPYVLFMGTFQRLVFLLAGILLLLSSGSHTLPVLVWIALTPFLFGLFSGAHNTAWQEMTAKTIPAHRMSSLMAARSIISGLLGMAAGGLVGRILGAYAGLHGFGVLYCTTFFFCLLSIITISLTKEPVTPPRQADETHSLHHVIASIRPIINGDKRLRTYLLMRIFASGVFVISPFIGLRALSVLQCPNSFLGNLVTMQMTGSLAGYFLGGLLGDRKGAKMTMVLSQLTMIVLAVWIIFARSRFEFAGVFLIFGMGNAFNWVSAMPMGLQISPVKERITYLTIISFASLPGFLLAWLLATFGRSLSSGMTFLSLFSATMMGISLYFLAKVNLPRPLRPGEAPA